MTKGGAKRSMTRMLAQLLKRDWPDLDGMRWV